MNELRFQFASRDQTVNSLDPKCGGACTLENQGGPTLEVLGVASVGRQRFTPQPRKNQRFQVLDTVSYFTGPHQFKAGFDFNYIDATEQSLPLHFGGRYIFGSIPAGVRTAVRSAGVEMPAIVAVQLGLPGRYVQGYGNSAAPYTYSDFSLFAQDDWRITPRLTAKLGVRYQSQFWPDISYNVTGYPTPYTFPGDGNNVAPRLGLVWDPIGDRKTSSTARTGCTTTTSSPESPASRKGSTAATACARSSPSLPTTMAAWNAPGRKLPEPASAYPSLVISIDPGLETPYAHHRRGGVHRELPGQIALAADFIYVRGFKQPSTLDYNPIVPSLGANRRPSDVNGVAGTSASVLQYTSFGETWYRGLTVVGVAAIHRSPSVPGQLHAVEGRGQRHRLPERVHRAGQRPRPQSERSERVAARVRPRLRKGAVATGSAAPLRRERHLRAAEGHRVVVDRHGRLRDGRTTFLRVPISTAMATAARPDRARATPADIADVGAAQRRHAARAGHRRCAAGAAIPRWDGPASTASSKCSTSSTARTTPRSTTSSAPASYPASPAPTFGQFTQAAPPRQVQLAVKIGF